MLLAGYDASSETSELQRGYYILNTDAGMESSGAKSAGEPPGLAAIGALLRTPRLAPLAEISKRIGRCSHNEAEYRALIEGLKLADQKGINRIRVYMDSELVVDQMNGLSAVKEPRLKKLHTIASELAGHFVSIRFSWVPREMNVEADRLASRALGKSR